MSTTSATVKKGHFCWADIAATDLTKVENFYTSLLGWSANRIDMGGGRSYTMLTAGDSEVGGMYQMDEAQKKSGAPSFWTSYVLVDEIDAKTKSAKDFGAAVIVEPFDVGDKGRMSVLQDPTGAMFAMWQDANQESVSSDGIGTVCWNELMTGDVDVANIFYKSVFGWKRKAADFPNMEYYMLMNGEEAAGGMMSFPEGASKRPHWLMYVSVEDCDKTLAKAKELGGEVVMPATEFEGVGRGGIVADPTGGVLGVIKLSNS